MKILITGATGFIGNRLIEELFMNGYDDINILTQNKKSALKKISLPVKAFEWNTQAGTIEDQALVGVNTVIHLAGESVSEGRWNSEKKKRILNSRIKGTQLLLQAIKKSKNPPQKFISASAIGIYGDRNGEALDETSSLGDGFLADVCKKWENIDHGLSGLQSHSLRIGIVLYKTGGALKAMLPAFKAGVAGTLGNGKQYMSWIHIDDLVRQFIFLVENKTNHTIYNGVAPNPVSNKVFTKTLGQVLNRPTLLPVPAFALRALFGEKSQIILNSQKVTPNRFLESGFKFKFNSLNEALLDILGKDGVLERYQWLQEPVEKVFKFFSDEKNLENITPPHLNFKVVNKSSQNIEAGTKINYKLKLHGVPLTWQSNIKSFEVNNFFIDEQVKGPYKKWVHTHNFYPTSNGTLIKDHINYELPLAPLGDFFGGPFVKSDLRKIFNYRKHKIADFFKTKEL